MNPAQIVYLLCAITSLLTAAILLREYRKNRVRFVLWSVLCFFGLALSNLLLFVDMVVFPNAIDLSLYRNIPTVLGYGILIYGFIWDAI